MAYQLFVGLFAEGSTDHAFLLPVVERLLSDIVFDQCPRDVEVEVHSIRITKSGLSFPQQVEAAVAEALSTLAISTLCVHTDADAASSSTVYASKIEKAREYLQEKASIAMLIPLVPVRMTESWLLADKQLLKEEIGTSLSNQELGIARSPESIADPKAVIEEAIRIARAGHSRRRRKDLTIGDLYRPIGERLELNSLRQLPSFQDFEENVLNLLKTLNLIP